MPTSIEQIDHTPIILLTIDDSVSESAIIDTYLRSTDLAKKVHGTVYRIVDVSEAETNYAMIIATITQIAQGMAGSAVSPDLAIVFVGQTHMTGMGEVRFYTDRDAALQFVQSQIGVSLPSLSAAS